VGNQFKIKATLKVECSRPCISRVFKIKTEGSRTRPVGSRLGSPRSIIELQIITARELLIKIILLMQCFKIMQPQYFISNVTPMFQNNVTPMFQNNVTPMFQNNVTPVSK